MTMQKSRKVWLDGQLVDWDQATVHVAAHVIHYGSSVFEGIRAYALPDGPAVFRLEEHLERLWNSCKIYRMEIPHTRQEIQQAILDTVRANGHAACYIRPVAFRGWSTFRMDARSSPTHVSIITVEMGRFLGKDAMKNGVDVGVSSWRRMAPNTYPAAAKIGGQYVNSQFIAMEAVDHGYSEGIALDVNGYVSEGSGENIFLVRRGRLLTPPLAGSILDGITRQSVFTLAGEMGLDVREELISRELLYLADEAFFCGTAAEITPIRSVDGITVGNGKRGPITTRLAKSFFDIVEGRVPDRHGWLTPVGRSGGYCCCSATHSLIFQRRPFHGGTAWQIAPFETTSNNRERTMDTLIRNVTAVTLDGQDRILGDVDIAIKDGIITAVERNLVFDKTPISSCEVIDGQEHVALPGLFNAHTHAAMTLERGWAEDLPFDRWLNEKIWVAESALEEEDVYWGAALACCEMIRAGVVGFADHYFWMDQVARAVAEAGMKAHLAWCQFGIGAEHEVGGVTLDDTIRFAREWHGASDGRIRCALGPHSPYMCPPEFLRRVVQAARELEAGIHLHVAESQEQVANSLTTHGQTPVAHLASLDVFDVPAIAAHCIAVNDEDVTILAERQVHVAHTPKTYLKLAMGMAPLPRLLEGGVNVALGSDGPASNSDLNMLEVLRITGLYHKNGLGQPEALPRTQLLRLATQAGAQALGFTGSGILAPGHPADLILLDTRAPHWFPRHDLAAGIVYAAHPCDVSHVIVDGRLLLRAGVLLTLDEERIRYEAERRAFRMVGAPLRQVRAYRG